MRIKGVKKPKPIKVKSHEEQIISDMFAEEGEDIFSPSPVHVDMNINLDPPKDKSTEIYTFADYGLTETQTMEKWEEQAYLVAQEFHPLLVSTLASFDAVKSVEQHLTDALKSSVSVLSESVIKDVVAMVQLKLKTLIMSTLSFSKEQEREIFTALVLKNLEQPRAVNPMDALSRYLTLDKETDPYAINNGGAVSMTKTLRKDQ